MVSPLYPLVTPERAGTLIPTDYRGQNAVNGELGMREINPRAPLSPSKWKRCSIWICSSVSCFPPCLRRRANPNDANRFAAGAHTTCFPAKPNDKLSELPIHPELSDLSELCIVCQQEKDEDDSPLECEKVCTYPSTRLPPVGSCGHGGC